MKRLVTLNFPAVGKQTVRRGELDLEKGRKMVGIRLKTVAPINVASGGPITLSDAQKQVFLDLWTFWLSYGKDGSRKPIDGLPGSLVHRLARFCYGSEIEGYTDTTTGLQRSLPNAATTNVTFYFLLPTGKAWFLPPADQRLLGCGRTQARSMQLDVQLNSLGPILANVNISGNVSMDVLQDTEPCDGDPWSAMVHLKKSDTSADQIESPEEGIHLLASERSTVHASTTMTSVSVAIDDMRIHEAISPADIITEYNDNAFATAAGSLTDRETVLFAVGPSAGANLNDLARGTLKVRQVVKNLAQYQGSFYFIPRVTRDEVEGALKYAVTDSRKVQVKAVSLGKAAGRQLPDGIEACIGFNLYDREDRQFEQFPGQTMAPGMSSMELLVPDSITDRGRKAVAGYLANKEAKAAEKLIRELTAAIPGSIPSCRGFSEGGSPELLAMSQRLAA